MLKGKNKVPPTKKTIYNLITKKFELEDDFSNIETELFDPKDNLTVNYNG